MSKRFRVTTVIFSLGLLVLGACDDETVGDVCDDEQCHQDCVDVGWAGGECVGVDCQCSDAPDSDADADADSDADSDADTCGPESCAGEGLECGRSSCGYDCGTCSEHETCQEGTCVCPPSSCDAEGIECGTSSCGHDCGGCAGAEVCEEGLCVCPASSCEDEGRECGESSCGQDCGTCPGGASCSGAGRCSCSPDPAEPNDEAGSALVLSPEPVDDESGGSFLITTSNTHTPTDIDWYRLSVEDNCCFTLNFDAVASLSSLAFGRRYRLWLEYDCHDGHLEEIATCDAEHGERTLERSYSGGDTYPYGCETRGTGPGLTVSMEVNCRGTSSETGVLFIGVEPLDGEPQCEPYRLEVWIE